jgi:hypothetical protein
MKTKISNSIWKPHMEVQFVSPGRRWRNTFWRCDLNLTVSVRKPWKVLGVKMMGFWVQEIIWIFLKKAPALFSSFPFLSYFPYFEKINISLCDHHAICVFLLLTSECLKKKLCEIWYVYHDTWTHLNGILHKSLPSIFASVCVSLLLLLGNGSVKILPRQKIHMQQ